MKHLQIISGEPIVLEGKTVLYYDGEETLTLTSGGSNSGASIVTEFTGEKTFASKNALSELNNWAVIGALLFASTADYIVQAGTWDPTSTTVTTPTKAGYTLIGVCVGKGLWASVQHSTTTTLKWASSSSDILYTTCHGINIHGNGWESTQHIFTHTDADLTGTIWASLTQRNGIDEYIPSKFELLEIFDNTCDGNHSQDVSKSDSSHTFNKNIGKLLSLDADSYWSSTQYSGGYGGYNYAYSVGFDDGYSFSSTEDDDFRSLALLHFGG